MATRSKSGLLPILLIVGAFVFFGDRILGGAQSVLDDITGEANSDYTVASGGQSLVGQCTADQILKERKCGDLKIVIIDATRMPFIARNIQLAWVEGKPFILHKGTPGSDQEKRAAACGPRIFAAQFDQGSCDEYPFASTQEGGAGARTEEVPLREQNCQGGTIRQEYRRAQINEGDGFLVVITNPNMIATSAYAGVDIAKDQSCMN